MNALIAWQYTDSPILQFLNWELGKWEFQTKSKSIERLLLYGSIYFWSQKMTPIGVRKKEIIKMCF